MSKNPSRLSSRAGRRRFKTPSEQSARKKEEAEALLSEWQRKVDSLNQEVKELHQRIRAEGEAEQKKIVSRAQEESERIRQQAGVIAEQELIKVRAALKKEMVDLSVELAEKLLKEAMKPQDQERLIQEYIGKVRELQVISLTVSRKYARAFLQIGQKEGNFEALGRELERLQELLQENKELRSVLFSLAYPGPTRKKIAGTPGADPRPLQDHR